MTCLCWSLCVVPCAGLTHSPRVFVLRPVRAAVVLWYRSLPQFSDGSFDAILDKGTLDSLMCGEHAGDNSMQMLEECHRYVRVRPRVRLVRQHRTAQHTHMAALQHNPEACAAVGSSQRESLCCTGLSVTHSSFLP